MSLDGPYTLASSRCIGLEIEKLEKSASSPREEALYGTEVMMQIET
jgi:hypothetical protein